MRLSDFKEDIEKLCGNDRLMFVHKKEGYIILTLYRNEIGDLCEYYNTIFGGKVIDDLDNGFPWLEDYDLKDIEVISMPYSAWCMYIKSMNAYLFFESATSDGRTNAKQILEEIKRDQGKLVDFRHDEGYKGILITVVVSDEDYYYVILDNKNEFQLHSCVGGYNVLSDKPHCRLSDGEISKKLRESFDKLNSIDAIVYRGRYTKDKEKDIDDSSLFICVSRYGDEFISRERPKRTKDLIDEYKDFPNYKFYVNEWECGDVEDWYSFITDSDYGKYKGVDINCDWLMDLPRGTIEHGLGRKLTYEDGVIEVKIIPMAGIGIKFEEITIQEKKNE